MASAIYVFINDLLRLLPWQHPSMLIVDNKISPLSCEDDIVQVSSSALQLKLMLMFVRNTV